MRLLIPVVLIAAGAIAASSVASGEQLMGASGVPQAPIGHLQPRADGFAPGSDANLAEQDRLSAFDAEQHKLDEMLSSTSAAADRQTRFVAENRDHSLRVEYARA